MARAPKLSIADPGSLTRMIQTRLTEGAAEDFGKLAESKHLSVATYVRVLIMREIDANIAATKPKKGH